MLQMCRAPLRLKRLTEVAVAGMTVKADQAAIAGHLASENHPIRGYRRRGVANCGQRAETDIQRDS
jgi:hypothetical protein